MKSLDERLEDREIEYERLVRAEHLVESHLEKILPLFPDNINCSVNIYTATAFLYISVDSVEDFEENIISKLFETVNVVWKREVSEDSISYYTDLEIVPTRKDLYLTVTSKPTNSCRIIAVPTGKMKTVAKQVTVDEPEVEYIIECNDD